MPKVFPEYKEEAKKKILAAGRDVISRKGYRATTMEDIADHLGVSKPTLYAYFGSKDQLVMAIIKGFPEQIREVAMSLEPAATPMDAWIAVIDFVLGNDSSQNALFFELLSLIPHNPEIAASFSDNMVRGLACSTPKFAEQQRQGLMNRDIDPRTMTLAIISLFQGLRYFSLIGFEKEELRERWIEIGKALFAYTESPAAKKTGVKAKKTSKGKITGK